MSPSFPLFSQPSKLTSSIKPSPPLFITKWIHTPSSPVYSLKLTRLKLAEHPSPTIRYPPPFPDSSVELALLSHAFPPILNAPPMHATLVPPEIHRQSKKEYQNKLRSKMYDHNVA